jgi:hypothetical protein
VRIIGAEVSSFDPGGQVVTQRWDCLADFWDGFLNTFGHGRTRSFGVRRSPTVPAFSVSQISLRKCPSKSVAMIARIQSDFENDFSAILSTGKAFRNWFSYDSRNVRLWLVVCFVKDHVPEFASVHKLNRILSTERSVLFLRAEAVRIRRVSLVTSN